MNIIDAIVRLSLGLQPTHNCGSTINRGANRIKLEDANIIDAVTRRDFLEQFSPKPAPKRIGLANENRPKCASKRAAQLCKAARQRMGL